MAKFFLLLDSCTGLNFASVRSSDKGITIHKGALIEKTRTGYIYQHRGGLAGSKYRPRPAVRYHITADVMCKELDRRQFELLSAISDDESRYQVYATSRLEWGCSVKSGDDVFVKRCGIDKPVAATVCCIKENTFGVEIKDPDYKIDRAASNNGKNFVTQAKKMSIDAYVALDKLYKRPKPISDNSKPYSRCSDGNEDEANSTNDDAPKLNYCKETTLYQNHTHSSAIEISKNPRVFEEVKADKSEHNEQKTVAQANSYYIEKFEQEHKCRMAAEDKVKELQIELKSIRENFREQKDENAQLHQENDQLKQELSDSQTATDQLKRTIEDLTEHDKVYQKELQDLQENVNQVKQDLDQVKEELDHSMAENAQLGEQVQALEADKEQLCSQVQSLLPASRWNIDHDELTITGSVLGTGAWGFVKEGEFHGTKVAVKGIHQAIISVADEIIPREFDMMAQVRHPNLVLLIGIVFNDPRHKGPLIITELLDCDMRSAYKEEKLDRQCRLPLLRDVAAALNYLHSRKQPIIHRDISSANVMLEASGNGEWKRAKLCDFGSARLTNSFALTPVPGAVVYSAPEILPVEEGDQAIQTVKVDVYSFGVLYTEILLARFIPNPGHRADNISKFISNLKRSEGKDIYHTAYICTNKNPKQRPTMQDVLHDIDQHIVASTAT